MTSLRIAVVSVLAVAAVLGGRAEIVPSAPAPAVTHAVAGGTGVIAMGGIGCCK